MARRTRLNPVITAVDAAASLIGSMAQIGMSAIAGGLVDSNGRATWLTHDASGGPTDYARSRFGLIDLAGSAVAGGFVDAAGRQTDLVFGPDGHVTDRVIGLWKTRMGVASQSDQRVAWGDSLTWGQTNSATPWTTPLANLLSKPVANMGIGGQWSNQIAARQGGNPPSVVVSGGQIPAGTTAVSVTVSVDLGGNQTGTLRGIPGTLTRSGAVGSTPDAGMTATFTRATAGSAVTVPNGTPFLTTAAPQYRTAVAYLWAGRNDLLKSTTSPQLCVQNIARMVDYIRNFTANILVLQIPPWVGEELGTSGRTGPNAVDAYNAAIQAAFPHLWVPIGDYLRTQAAATAAGITFTSQDNTDISNGLTPTSLRSDSGHPNTAGNQAIATRLYQEELQRGWI